MDSPAQQICMERLFIINVLRSFVSGVECPVIPKSLDWTRFESILVRNKLVPIFHSMLPKGSVSKTRMESWKRQSVEALFLYCHASKSALRLFNILESEGIPAVALRGMALAERIYPEPSQRPMSDVDIMIHSNAKDIIVDKLKAHGLVPYQILRSQFVYNINNTKFEIHWSFLTPKRYRKASNFNLWLSSRESVKITGGEVPCLKPEDELIELVCHAFIHHELDRILQVVDIALLIKHSSLDWAYIRAWCRDASMTRLVGFTLAYVDHLFDLDIGEQLAQFTLPDPHKKAAAFEAYISYMFMEDKFTHFVRRKRNLLYAAEKHGTKFKQFIRFLNTKDFKRMIRLLAVRSKRC